MKITNCFTYEFPFKICIAFIRPHLDYCDVIIYDKIFNVSWHKKLESTQYNIALAKTGAIRGTNTEKVYRELGLESLLILQNL